MRVDDVREYFIDNYKNKNFVIDRTGVKTIELLGASFLADEDTIFGAVNRDYVDVEIAWYESQSLNINDIYGGERRPPEAWEYTANKHGEINSNYGYLIFSEEYHNQYECAVNELRRNPNSRRAIMIYNRPSMQVEFCKDGRNDFVCTNAHTFYIRDDKIHVVVQMRSNDLVYGYRNDLAWAKYVQKLVVDDLYLYNYDVGNVYWQVQNLHVYERHFWMIDCWDKFGMNLNKNDYDKCIAG